MPEAATCAERKATTVVFVDVVGSTALAAAIGDERWADLLERYQQLVRRELAAAGGEEMDTAGDGVFAIFDDPAAAMMFGCAVAKAVRGLCLQLRVGVHTGTCWVVGRKCAGLDVSIGARIAAAAAPGELLVSAAVRDRVAADGRFAFRARGDAELKGVPGRWPLYAASTAPVERRLSHDGHQGRRN